MLREPLLTALLMFINIAIFSPNPIVLIALTLCVMLTSYLMVEANQARIGVVGSRVY